MKNILVGIGCFVLAGTLAAQTNTNDFIFTVKPADKAIMIAETTNALFLTITNLTLTNTTVDPDPTGGTNSVTNIVLTALFTNVNVTATYPGGPTIKLLDAGAAPDKTSGDGIFSGNFIAPTTSYYTDLTMTYMVSGDSLTFTNETGEQVPLGVTNTTKVSYHIVARPANDRFTNAFKVVPAGGTFVTTNNYASLETGEPQHAKIATDDASIWWMWSTPFATNVLIDTAGSSFSPALGVYTGTAVGKLTEVASSADDKVLNLKAHVNFDAVAGVTYRIAVAGQNTNGVGDVRLRIAPGATADTNGPGVVITSPSDGALFTTNLVAFAGTAAELKPNESGVQKIFLQVNALKPVLASGAETWSKTLDLPAGTNTIAAFAVDYAGNTGAVYSVSVTFMNPTNDNFASAIALPGSAGQVVAINGRATKELGEPIHGGNEGGHSIWYTWQAPANGVLALSTTNSDFDTLLGLYTGDSVSNLTTIASNDDAFEGSKYSAINQFVNSNQVYRIAVDGYGGASGRVQLTYNFNKQSPPQFYTLTINNAPGGNVQPPTSYFAVNATAVVTAFPDPNYAFVRWEGTTTATNNPLTLVMRSDQTLTPRFRLVNYIETFESGTLTQLPWVTSGDQPWFVQTNTASDSLWSAQSGAIGDSQQSTLQLTLVTLAGSGSFDFRVSSETSWDFLEFSVNGTPIKQWSGEQTWRTFFFDVTAGTNTVTWRYAKDAHFSEGLDAAFIDNIYLPVGSLASVLKVSNNANQIQLELQGKLNQSYLIQGSTNLTTWDTLSTNRSADGVIQFVDPRAAQFPFRFYRAVTQ